MLTALINGRILTDQGVLDGRAVLIEDGRIHSLVSKSDVPASAAAFDLDGLLLMPGFIDMQVNGGGGVLFDDTPNVETLRRSAAAHRRFGTTAFLPTLISSDLDVVAAAIAAVDAAIGPASRACSASISRARSSTPSARASTTRPNSAGSIPAPLALADLAETGARS